jgi:hypothetical protein
MPMAISYGHYSMKLEKIQNLGQSILRNNYTHTYKKRFIIITIKAYTY